MIELSKEADKLLYSIYKMYSKRRKNSISKNNAKMTGSVEDIQTNCMPEWTTGDVFDTCKELHRAKCLNCFFASNTFKVSELTSIGITYCESKTNIIGKTIAKTTGKLVEKAIDKVL